MLTPEELYYQYSTDPCEYGRQGLDSEEASVGKGTPYDLAKLANFLKQLKYPCYSKAPNEITGTGSNQLALSFRFLQKLDVEAFFEIQPDIKSGTSHAIRNACDVMRACSLEAKGQRLQWEHRSATEHMEYFGKNSITDCLMVLGPDLVAEEEAAQRATGCGVMDCLNAVGVLPLKTEGVALGAGFACIPLLPPGSLNNKIGCSTCDFCPEDDPDDPCCLAQTCEQKIRICCHDTSGQRQGIWDWRKNTADEAEGFLLKHIGILKRKSYGGYANLLNNSGPEFYACPADLLLSYFQTINQYDYKTYTDILSVNQEYIERVKTISLVLPTAFPSQKTIPEQIKDLIYNGYGVVLMSNIGFPNKRDSSGVSYPDRIWYHTYAVVGYDDRKTEYSECVFLLANSWGRWNTGGHPSWGPIPDGSFLVTESHLNCMTQVFRSDKVGCRTTTTINRGKQEIRPGCFPGVDNSCSPWECATKQKATGLVFALSLENGFPKQDINHAQFYRQRRFFPQSDDT